MSQSRILNHNSDGTWWHKRGTTPIQKVDASGQLIYDPEFADRDDSTGLNYDVFVQWYAMKSMDEAGFN